MQSLLTDQYGNYVIQHILEHGPAAARHSAIDAIRTAGVTRLALHKFGSNVLERALQHGTAAAQRALIDDIVAPSFALYHANRGLPDDEIVGPDGATPLQALVRDAYGNFVAQRILDVANDEQRSALIEMLRAGAPILARTTFGKHILARMERVVARLLVPPPPPLYPSPGDARSDRVAGGASERPHEAMWLGGGGGGRNNGRGGHGRGH